MATSLWETRTRLEATRAMLANLEKTRYETAHGWVFPNLDDKVKWKKLKEREEVLLKMISE